MTFFRSTESHPSHEGRNKVNKGAEIVELHSITMTGKSSDHQGEEIEVVFNIKNATRADFTIPIYLFRSEASDENIVSKARERLNDCIMVIAEATKTWKSAK